MFESEERRIAERIKDFIKKEEPISDVYIMLRNGRILNTDKYYGMISSGKINPHDAYVYIDIGPALYKSDFYYPILNWYGKLLDAYLSKLGFHYLYFIVPATGLKYVAFALRYENYLSIELANLDTVVNNTNLRKIVFEELGDKIISEEKVLTKVEYDIIYVKFRFQQLFAGYTLGEAWNIINEYYDEGNRSLTKEVARIVMDYVDIFRPYRVCYDMKSWEEVDCRSIKL